MGEEGTDDAGNYGAVWDEPKHLLQEETRVRNQKEESWGSFLRKPILLRKTVSVVENRLPIGVLHSIIIEQRT